MASCAAISCKSCVFRLLMPPASLVDIILCRRSCHVITQFSPDPCHPPPRPAGARPRHPAAHAGGEPGQHGTACPGAGFCGALCQLAVGAGGLSAGDHLPDCGGRSTGGQVRSASPAAPGAWALCAGLIAVRPGADHRLADRGPCPAGDRCGLHALPGAGHGGPAGAAGAAGLGHGAARYPVGLRHCARPLLWRPADGRVWLAGPLPAAGAPQPAGAGLCPARPAPGRLLATEGGDEPREPVTAGGGPALLRPGADSGGRPGPLVGGGGPAGHGLVHSPRAPRPCAPAAAGVAGGSGA